MNLKFFLVVFFSISISGLLFAQEYELGEVTIDELKESVHPVDSSAAAAILFKTGVTRLLLNDGNWTVETEVKYKIKIYKKEGFNYANKSLSYYIGGFSKEFIKFKNAVTYNLVNGKIEKTKLKSDGEFTEEINKDVKVKKITMPQVKEGSIIEYSYTLDSPYITTFNDWYFQYDIPVNYVEYNVYIPEYFKYRSVISGYENIDLQESNVPATNFNQLKVKYSGKNIPPLKQEGFISNINNYTSLLKYELASISYPNQPTKNIAITWDDVVKSIYDHENFGDELKKTSYFGDDLKSILSGVNSNDEKIYIIFNYVKNRMVWNNKYGVITDVGVKKAYNDRTGNAAEINLILTAMLREAGINANPILLSTRDNGVALFPNRTAFNYVVSGIEVQNDVILLDATSKNAVIDLLPLRALNWTGRIIRERGSSNQIDLLGVPMSKDNVTILGEIKEDGKVEGKLRRVLTDYNSFIHRENFSGVAEDSYLEKLENRYSGLSVSDYKVDNMKDLYKPIVETYSFSYDNDVEMIGNKMYIQPLLFFSMTENPFKLEERKYPVDFSFPFKDAYNITIKFPEGYEVDYLPEPLSIVMDDNSAAFKYVVSNVNNNIQLMVNFDINNFYVSSKSYAVLKKFFKQMVERQNDKIILKKKS